MDNMEYKTNLTCGEISHLWMAYQYETLSKCGITFFLQHVDDLEIEKLLQDALSLSTKRIDKITALFNREQYPIPQGFTDGDVNLNAPRLFSDKLYLEYVLQTLMMEATNYSDSLMSSVDDMTMEFFKEVINDSQNLEIKTKRVAKEKGLFIRMPQIPTPKHIEFVKKDSFIAGWFKDRRPLLGIEIANLVLHAKRNALGQAVITAFSQVAGSKDTRVYLERGRDIAGKHLVIFSDVLRENFLPDSSELFTSEVTESTESPFSDKLMMVFITELIGSSIGGYGVSMSRSPRHDLGLMYSRLIVEIAQYCNDGVDILIGNGWMEQPPIAADRKKLAR